ncbi:hypothetical protein K2Q00_01040 [Patescibacteria group bacterium]|nr:hypothetical protein [Patescibacteria group bacterium]
MIAAGLVMSTVWNEEKKGRLDQLPRLYAISVCLGWALGLQTKDSVGQFTDADMALYVSIIWYLWALVSLVLMIRVQYRLYWLDVRAGRR